MEHRFLKGVYTIEAAWIVSICLSIMAGGMILSVDIFNESVAYIRENRGEDMDAPKIFREIAAGKGIFEKLTGE